MKPFNEKPILFNDDMIRAILNGKKTQTRRPVKNADWNACLTGDCAHMEQKECDRLLVHSNPFGQPGDRLWVREAHIMLWKNEDGEPDEDGNVFDIFYRATDPRQEYYDESKEENGQNGLTTAWKPSIHMRREHSRIDLEITNIRIEHLHDITETDASAEGVKPVTESPLCLDRFRSSFSSLWDGLYGNWNQNPFVWVIEFKRVEA